MEPQNEIWHRPEFKDRRDELINNKQAAAIAGVSFITVSSWKQRFTDFPQTVVSFTDKTDKMVHEGEFRDWHQRYLATRGQKGRPNYIAPTNRQRSEPELRARLTELRSERASVQRRLARLDARIAKEEARLNEARVRLHQESEQRLREAIKLIGQIDAERRDPVVEAVLDRAEQQWRPTADTATPGPANDPVAAAFPPDVAPAADTVPAERHQDTSVLEEGTAAATYRQR